MKRTVKPWSEYGRYGSVGIELVASIMLGWYGGHWLDGKIAGGHGWLTALGFVVGVYAGFRALFATAAKMTRDIERAERREKGLDPWSTEHDDLPSPPDPIAPTHAPSSRADGDEKPHGDA